MIKLLLYCTKQPLYLVRNECDGYFYTMDKGTLNDYKNVETYNGKIVAECDFEVEKYKVEEAYGNEMRVRCKVLYGNVGQYSGNDEMLKNILKGSCLTNQELTKYMAFKDMWSTPMYAIHIKNLHIFDRPRELSDYYIIQNENANPIDIEEDIKTVKKAPQNMMYCWDFILEYRIFKKFKKKIIISIRPEYLVKILNGEKTIEIRKKVLKKMTMDK